MLQISKKVRPSCEGERSKHLNIINEADMGSSTNEVVDISR